MPCSNNITSHHIRNKTSKMHLHMKGSGALTLYGNDNMECICSILKQLLSILNDPTMDVTICYALYLTQMMDVMNFSTKWQRDIGIRCMINSNLKYISVMVQFARGVHLSNVFNMENSPWMYRNYWPELYMLNFYF